MMEITHRRAAVNPAATVFERATKSQASAREELTQTHLRIDCSVYMVRAIDLKTAGLQKLMFCLCKSAQKPQCVE